MTTWYKCRPPGFREQWGFSVRPDLWPAGSVVGLAATDQGWLANWDVRTPTYSMWDGPLEEYAAPGAAEALILSGASVRSPSWDRTHWPWVEVSPPR